MAKEITKEDNIEILPAQQGTQSPKSAQTIAQQPRGESLSAEEIAFSSLVSQGMTLTSAYRKAFPLKKDLAYDTIRRYAHELYAKENIKTEVETKRETTARLARLAEDRLQQILETDDSMAKGNKVADVAMFMYDHVNGKAIQQMNVQSTSVNIAIDLSGASE